MAASKRQTTMAKLTRERAVQEKRERKREKKQALRDAKLAGTSGEEVTPSEDEPTAGEAPAE